MTNESNQKVKIQRDLVREGGLARAVEELKIVTGCTLLCAFTYNLGLNGYLDEKDILTGGLGIGTLAYIVHGRKDRRTL